MSKYVCYKVPFGVFSDGVLFFVAVSAIEAIGSRVASVIGVSTMADPSRIPAVFASSIVERDGFKEAGVRVGLLSAFFFFASDLFMYSLMLSTRFGFAAGLWTAPFMVGAGKACGKLVPNGDCAIEPVAEEGVTLPESVPGAEKWVEREGVTGIWTRRSGDFCPDIELDLTTPFV